MAETVLDQILVELRKSAATEYAGRGELKNLRVVGHTPKNDHFIYDLCVDFTGGPERLAAKVYRAAKCSGNARAIARTENENLQHAYQELLKKKVEGVPRPIGDFSEMGAVVMEKIGGLPLQSIIMKAALLPGFADNGSIALVARRAGEWLRGFHKATQDLPEPFDGPALITSLEQLCESCRHETRRGERSRHCGIPCCGTQSRYCRSGYSGDSIPESTRDRMGSTHRNRPGNSWDRPPDTADNKPDKSARILRSNRYLRNNPGRSKHRS